MFKRLQLVSLRSVHIDSKVHFVTGTQPLRNTNQANIKLESKVQQVSSDYIFQEQNVVRTLVEFSLSIPLTTACAEVHVLYVCSFCVV